jgi:antitoxin MazE
MRTSVQKWGNSLALRLPKSFAVECGIVEGSAVDLSVRDGGLVVVPVAEDRYTLADLVAGMPDENRHEEDDPGPSVGNESW